MRVAVSSHHRQPQSWRPLPEPNPQVPRTSRGAHPSAPACPHGMAERDLQAVGSKHRTVHCSCRTQVDQPLLARVTVVKVSGRRIMFETDCFQRASGAVVADGEAAALLSQ